jgi:hypothetical protein
MARKQKGGFPFTDNMIGDIVFWVFMILVVVGIILLSLWLTGVIFKPNSVGSSGPQSILPGENQQSLAQLSITNALVSADGKSVAVTYKTTGQCLDSCDVMMSLSINGVGGQSKSFPMGTNTVTLDATNIVPGDIQVDPSSSSYTRSVYVIGNVVSTDGVYFSPDTMFGATMPTPPS